jgi:hypothetical protein
MDSKFLAHLKGSGLDRINIPCLTLTETFILLVLRTQPNNDVAERGSRWSSW